MKSIILLLGLFIVSSCSSVKKTEETIWLNNKLTVEQPFSAKVIGTCDSWVGVELLLKELGAQTPRFCYVNIASTFAIDYKIMTTLDESKKLLINSPNARWTLIEPGVRVDDFSYKNALHSIGKDFKEKDLLYQRVSQELGIE